VLSFSRGTRRLAAALKQAIVGYHLDDEGHWVAELACGHAQHVRHDPPWQVRPWVLTEDGRHRFLGTLLECPYCDQPSQPSDSD
jgi:hypothetical protein